MKLWRLTLGLGALAALIAATYEGLTWTDTCSGDSFQILCFSRSDVMVLGGIFGFVTGAACGVLSWALWTLTRRSHLAGRSASRVPERRA
jgi:hypothetical protein